MTKFDTSKISQIATISRDDWITVNQRAGLVTAPQPLGGLYYQQFANIPTLDQLKSVCSKWKTTSWPLVVDIVERTKSFAEELSAFLEEVLAGGGEVSTLEKLAEEASYINSLAHQFNPLASEFYDVNLEADSSPQRHYYSSSITFHDISPVTNAVEMASTTIVVGWGNIEDDMAMAIEAMEAAETGFGDFMSVVELETAKQDWDEVVTKFQQSLGDMDEAAGELTGEAAYEHIPLEEGKSYYVQLDNPDEPIVLTVGCDGSLVGQNNKGEPNQQWCFTKNGYGWFSLASIDPKFSKNSADVLNNDPYKPVMAPTSHDATGQNYRIVEVDDGSMRIVNLQVELKKEEQRVLKSDGGTLSWEYLVIEGQSPPPPSYIHPRNQMWKFIRT